MKPWDHAVKSRRLHGGKVEDYLDLHDWFDQTKAALPDLRHRMVLHNAMGIFIAEQVFGHVLKNSDGKDIPVRTLAEQHVIDDLGRIPTLEECFKGLPMEPWMAGIRATMVKCVD